MDWLKELLGEDLYKQVTAKLGDKKLLLNDGNYIPKGKFDEKNEEVKLLKEKVTNYEKQVKDTESLLKDNADLKGKFETLQGDSQKQLLEKDKQILNIQKKTALIKVLQDNGAIYPDLLIKSFNFDELILEGETIKDIDNHITTLKTGYANMFEQKQVKGKEPDKGTPPKPTTKKQELINKYNEAQKNKNVVLMMTIEDQIKQIKE